MLDVSWGETLVVLAVSVTVIGRNDLPKASRFLGKHVGRIVGLLQGARARADRFTVDNELSALQSELRSGLRELDTVKGELAVAASSQGMMGRGLRPSSAGGGVAGGRIQRMTTPQAMMGMGMGTNPSALSGSDYLAAARNSEMASSSSSHTVTASSSLSRLAPRKQSVAAVAEEEWEKQGIGFRSRAEMGTGSVGPGMMSPGGYSGGGGSLSDRNVGGSSLLADVFKQNLIHDQYDRAVMEQDRDLEERMEQRRNETKDNDSMDVK